MIRTWLLLVVALAAPAVGAEPARRLLLLGQGPDGHPPGTHEYVAGQTLLARALRNVPGLQTQVVRADGDWAEGPDLLAKADGVVLFVSEGAKWLSADPRRYEAFARLAERKGGLFVIHWGMGTKEAANIEPFVRLFGACHGGPDRKYKVVETRVRVTPDHPATAGLGDFTVHEEFYYRLKQVDGGRDLQPLLKAEIEEEAWPVAWAWTRKDGGRSAGFSGLHFHANWEREVYRRFVGQAVLWTLDLPVPRRDFPAPLEPADFTPPAAAPK